MYDSFFQTKLYLLLASIELSQRPEASGVVILMTDPGPFKPALVREAPWPIGWIKNLFSMKVDAAADHILYIAQSDEACSKSGRVFRKREEFQLAPYWQNVRLRQRLWTNTAALLRNYGNFQRIGITGRTVNRCGRHTVGISTNYPFCRQARN